MGELARRRGYCIGPNGINAGRLLEVSVARVLKQPSER
jgi:hypothetical protein